MKFNLNYTTFVAKAKQICGERVFTTYLMRFALGTDASCYNYTPRVAIKAHNEDEVIALLKLASECQTPVTFRAAGSSLSGQCSSEHVLIIANEGFKGIKVSDDASIIECECGVIASDANAELTKFGRKIGPDPATITTALVGGIYNNNSSGMCCGVEQNSYNTISSVRAVLLDGTVVDTADSKSVSEFASTPLAKKLLELSSELKKDAHLCELIERKYKIKNTTGYSLNALKDFDDVREIFNHILIGSEGTLAFVSKVRYFTVPDARFKACGLLFFETLKEASKAVIALSKMGREKVVSAEMMDYACLMAVKNIPGVPAIVKECKEGYSCILFQSENEDESVLNSNLGEIKETLKSVQMAFEPLYSNDEKEFSAWWKIRKGILPIVAGERPKGTTIITEDVCFEIEKFTDGIALLQDLFKKYNFLDGVIFGHALAGNLHFNITPDLKDPVQYENFSALVKEMSENVAHMGGSAKAEHGTGRMVAPFVEVEWGKNGYEFNRRIKTLFDPSGLLNPDVIISDDPDIYKKNLKTNPKAILNLPENDEMINKCMECGFCEKHCPSRNLTLTPRQRIAVLREVTRLLEADKKSEASELLSEYEYAGDETCAGCSACLSLCPLSIDTAKVAAELRRKVSGETLEKAKKLYDKFESVMNKARSGMKFYAFGAAVLGENGVSKVTSSIRKIYKKFPFTPPAMPRANSYKLANKGSECEEKVVYFTSCTNRIFKPSSKLNDTRSVQEVVESLCKKAKVGVIYPEKIGKMCCGKMFEDYESIQKENAAFLREELKKASENGKWKVVTDHSSCFYATLKQFEGEFEILDISEFLLHIAPRLTFKPTSQPVLVHRLCLLKKLGRESAIMELAKKCSTDVRVIKSFECCGFAGKKGFFTPELNQSSTAKLRFETSPEILGVSTSSTCEIGLNAYGNSKFENIAYLVDKVTTEK